MDKELFDRLLASYEAGEVPARDQEAAAVKGSLAELVDIAPGHSVEIRVVPYAAVQAIPGAHHRRGTPPATVECDARTWIELVTGTITWQEARSTGRIDASGERSDLSRWLPLTDF